MTQRVRGWLLASFGLLAVGGAFFAACSEKPAPSGAVDSGFGGSDATAQAPADAAGDGSGDGLDGGGACSTVDPEGSPLVAQTVMPGPRPAATGGELFQGTYWLTTRYNYAGAADTNFVRRVLLIEPTAKTVEFVEGTAATANAAPTLSTASGTFQIFDQKIFSMKLTCPAAQLSNLAYTANGGALTIYPDDESAELYELQ